MPYLGPMSTLESFFTRTPIELSPGDFTTLAELPKRFKKISQGFPKVFRKPAGTYPDRPKGPFTTAYHRYEWQKELLENIAKLFHNSIKTLQVLTPTGPTIIP